MIKLMVFTPPLQAVIMDMDGTALQQTGDQDVWRRFFAAAGLLEECQALVKKYHIPSTNSMTPQDHRRFFQESVGLLRGRDAVSVMNSFTELPYTAGFLEFCHYLHQHGVKIGLVTLSIDAIAQQIQQEAGLEMVLGNEIHVHQGRFTGTGKLNVPYGSKGVATTQIYTRLGATRATTAFFGDSSNDLDSWRTIDYPFGINAKPEYRHLLSFNFIDFEHALDYFERAFLGDTT